MLSLRTCVRRFGNPHTFFIDLAPGVTYRGLRGCVRTSQKLIAPCIFEGEKTRSDLSRAVGVVLAKKSLFDQHHPRSLESGSFATIL
jgi:hypothetical protein